MPEDQSSHITVPNLTGIISDNDVLNERLVKAKQELIEASRKLGTTVGEVNTPYAQEIEEGTKRKQLLIEQGTYLRTENDDGNPLNAFVPSKETPTLNALYFLARDGGYDNSLDVLRIPEDVGKDVEELRQQFDDEFGTAFDAYEASKIAGGEGDLQPTFRNAAKDFEAFLYEGGSYDVFVKLKKLKSLTQSSNEIEARLAKEKCLELCVKFNIDYDRIPSF